MPICIDTHDICIAPAYQAVTEASGPMSIAVDAQGKPIHPRTADVDRLGARIDIFEGDFLTAYRTVGTTALPAPGGTVIYYAKTCSGAGWRCTYNWAIAPDSAPHYVDHFNSFTIDAKSKAGLSRAEKNIWLLVDPKGAEAKVSLTALTVVSSTFEPVTCNPGYPEPGCPDMGARGARIREQDAVRRLSQPQTAVKAETTP